MYSKKIRPISQSCPFCGSQKITVKNKLGKIEFNGAGMRREWRTFSARCNVCKARGPVSGRWVYIKSDLLDGATEAEEKWIKRANGIVGLNPGFVIIDEMHNWRGGIDYGSN